MVTPKSASTVVLLKQGPRDSLYVLMLKRNVALEFVGGAYVFPGGKVDVADSNPDLYARCNGLDDSKASELLGICKDGLSYYVCAVRESFEEAGVLLGSVRAENLGDSDLSVLRSELNSGKVTFADMARKLDLVLDCTQLTYFSHWITPEGSPRRYDTRFFVAEMPSAQDPGADSGETTSHIWVTPSQALESHQEGRFEMILPTVKTLELFLEFSSVKDALAWARSQRDVPTILPKLVSSGDSVEAILPDNPAYASSEEVYLKSARDIPL